MCFVRGLGCYCHASSHAACCRSAESVKTVIPLRLVCALNCYLTAPELQESLEDHWRNDYPDTSGLLAAPSGKAITVLFGRE